MRSKVLHLIKASPLSSKGGTETVVNTLVKGIHGFRSTVLTFGNENQVERIKIVRRNTHLYIEVRPFLFCFSTPLSLSYLILAFKLAKRTDVVHWHVPFPSIDLLILLRLIDPRKILVTYHSDIVVYPFLRGLYELCFSKILTFCNKIVGTSHEYVDTSRFLKLLSGKVKLEVIELGLDDVAKGIKVSLEDKNERLIMFLGADRHYKGLNQLLEAVSGLDVELLVVGPVCFEKYRYAHDHNNTNFIGEVDDNVKFELLRRASIVVLPSTSRAEAFGLSLVEGAMFSCALISTELGTGTSLVNRNGYTGLVVEPSNSGAIRAAVTCLISNNGKLREMQLNSRRRYELRFSAESFCQKYEDLYIDVLDAELRGHLR